ncbi:hypothetical protein EXIGLDRAFT_471264 [Exidia glandulosa HHB12029]|uniref:Uncharacterized protein n=1 Tax=Exidia glandulosa HHB12029 TaxID=1314781 RepID=A0A165AU79_EXIGL|nr:hypothetical protein EXIGLDRAFT_471264 [Exidia glandulosa HHB12029]
MHCTIHSRQLARRREIPSPPCQRAGRFRSQESHPVCSSNAKYMHCRLNISAESSALVLTGIARGFGLLTMILIPSIKATIRYRALLKVSTGLINSRCARTRGPWMSALRDGRRRQCKVNSVPRGSATGPSSLVRRLRRPACQRGVLPYNTWNVPCADCGRRLHKSRRRYLVNSSPAIVVARLRRRHLD